MRLLICGSRFWKNKQLIKTVLQEILYNSVIECIVEGEAKGADSMGRELAEELGIPVLKFPADWQHHGKAAGYIRNQQMIIEAKPDFILAFHNDITNSKGTKDMIKQAIKYKIPYRIITE